MIRNTKHTAISFFDSLKIKIEGLANNEIQSKLNPQVPINDVILKISKWLIKLQAIKFQGKPVKIEPLINSKTPKNNEKIKKELTIFLGFEIIKQKVDNP